MIILTSVTANNKFQIKRFRLAEGYSRPKISDDSLEVREASLGARSLQKTEAITKILKNQCEVRAAIEKTREYVQKAIFSEYPETCIGTEILAETNQNCPLSRNIKIVRRDGNGAYYLDNTDYYELAHEKKIALDLLKKSQQVVQKPRNWGKKQRQKVFRYQAGQKILEGGAIIDRFCGAENSTMITTTIPGSTERALDCVARWSGWIMNRVLQVVRRTKKTDPKPYWFFVLEHQKRGALHLHMCLGWKVSRQKRELLASRIANKWYECLLELEKKDGIDCFERQGFSRSWRNSPEKWQTRIEQIKYSVAAYFAKYCQKQTRDDRDNEKKPSRVDETGRRKRARSGYRNCISCPSRYWGSSGSVKKWVKFISRTQRYEAFCSEETETILGRIRRIALEGFDFAAVTISPFEVCDERTGIVICSGEVESYRLRPQDFPRFWSNFVDHVCEREYGDMKMYQEFVDSCK